MFASAKLGRGFKGLVEYQLTAERDQENQIIGGNLPASNPKLAVQQLVECAEQRKGVRKPVMHMIVAWHPKDEVTDQDMGEAGERLLKAYGFDLDNHQYLMVRHTDTPHPHLHVVANRVGMDGSLVKDKDHPLRKLRAEADAIEQERGYTPAIPIEEREGGTVPLLRSMGPEGALPGREAMPLQAMEARAGIKAAKRIVHEAVREALLKCDGTFESVDEHLRQDGVVAPSWSFNGNGEFNGASFTLLSATRPGEAEIGPHGGTYTFKGSQLGPKPGLSKGAILGVLKRKSESNQRRREFASRKDFTAAARNLRTIQQKMNRRMTVGAHLGRRLSKRSSYLTPMSGKFVSSILRLFDNRRFDRALQAQNRPNQRPTRRR